MVEGRRAVQVGFSMFLLASASWMLVLGSEHAIYWAVTGIVIALASLAMIAHGIRTLPSPDDSE